MSDTLTVVRFRVEILEPTLYVDRGFQTACNWESYTLPVGIYDVVPQSNLPEYQHFLVPNAVIVESYFVNRLFSSSSVGDRFKHTGETMEKWIPFVDRYLWNPSDKKYDWLARYAEANPTFKIHDSEAK